MKKLLCAVLVALCSDTAQAQVYRNVIQQDTTYYFSSHGTDQPGCPTDSLNGCRTRQYIINWVTQTEDCGGHYLYLQSLDDGPFTDGFQQKVPIPGCAPDRTIIAAHSPNTAYVPAPNVGPAFGADGYGTGFVIQNGILDQRNNPGNDIIDASHGAKVTFSSGLTFGCAYQNNAVTVTTGAAVTFQYDITLNPGYCQQSGEGTETAGSSVVQMSDTSSVPINFGIIGSNIPADAHVVSKTTSTITFACIRTVACYAGATTSELLTFVGGGQTFIDLADGGSMYVDTNGTPDSSLLVTLANYPFYYSAFILNNTLNGVNAQAWTFVNATEAHGACAQAVGYGVTDTGKQGVPYFPCLSGGPEAAYGGVAVTAGSSTITLPNTQGLYLNQVVTDVVYTTGSWSSGASQIAVASCAGVDQGAHILGAGMLAGATVAGCSGTTLTLDPCSNAGTRCVGGYPTYIAEASVPITISGSYMSNQSVVTSINTSTSAITISDAPLKSGANLVLWFQGRALPATYR